MTLAYHGTPYIEGLIREKTLFCNLLVHSHLKIKSRMFDKRYADFTKNVAQRIKGMGKNAIKELSDDSSDEVLVRVFMGSGLINSLLSEYNEDIRRCFVFLTKEYESAREYAALRSNTLEKYTLPRSVVEFDLPQELIIEMGNLLLVKKEVPLSLAKKIYCDEKDRISSLLQENNLTHIEISDLL